jgi:hypothetical protein
MRPIPQNVRFPLISKKFRVTGWTFLAALAHTHGEITFTNAKVETVSGGIIIEGENEWLMADWH